MPDVPVRIMRPAPEPRFTLVHAADLVLRPPQWLVKGVLELDTTAVLFGPPKCGKSFAAIDLACCVASGLDFHGHPVKRLGHVIYLAGEGHAGITRRLHAWTRWRHVDLRDLSINVSTRSAAISDPEVVAEVIAAVDRAAKVDGAPVLVIVDTLARNFGAGDENSTRDMGLFVRGLDRIRIQYGCAVIVVHHTGHNDQGRARGSINLKASIDAEYRMNRDDEGVMRFEALVMKDASIPPPMAFKLHSIDLGLTDEDGLPITSCVLQATEYEPRAKSSKSVGGKHQLTALRVLHELMQKRRAELSAKGSGSQDAWVFIADWRSACVGADIPRKRFYELRASLSDSGQIRIKDELVRPT